MPVQLAAIRQLLSAATPSAPVLKELAWWLAENRVPDPVQLSLLADIKGENAVLARMERGDIDPGTVYNPATGQQTTISGVDFFRMQDGRQAEHWGGPDMFSFLVQAGVMPGPGAPGPGTPT